jgi:hypothetical protein
LKREVKPVVNSAKIVANTSIRNNRPNSLEKKKFLIDERSRLFVEADDSCADAILDSFQRVPRRLFASKENSVTD